MASGDAAKIAEAAAALEGEVVLDSEEVDERLASLVEAQEAAEEAKRAALAEANAATRAELDEGAAALGGGGGGVREA